MVQADVARSTQGVSQAFEDRDMKTLAVTGGLAAIGFTVAATVGSALARLTPGGLMPFGRMESAVVGLGAALAAMGGISYLPGYLSGPMAVGALVVVGLAVMATIFGPGPAVDDGYFRSAIDQTGVDPSRLPMSGLSGLSGCSTCGSAPSGPSPVRRAGKNEIREVAQERRASHFR